MEQKKQAVEVADIGRLDLIEVDPYRRDPVTPAAVRLLIEPERRHAELGTYSPGQGVRMDIWEGKTLAIPTYSKYGRPVDGPAIVEWLRGPKGQSLLGRICDGHYMQYMGSNYRGRLTDDAQAALDDLGRWLSDAPALDGEFAGLWDADDWLGAMWCQLRSYGISDATTDEQLAEIATRINDEAASENAVLIGTLGYLRWYRNELREE